MRLTPFKMFIWTLLNVVLLILLVGLFLETINGDYSWLYFWLGTILVCLVNISILLEVKRRK